MYNTVFAGGTTSGGNHVFLIKKMVSSDGAIYIKTKRVQ